MLVERPDYARYNVVKMPESDRWGLVMPAGCALAQKDCITFEDLLGLPLFCSGQGWHVDLPLWCGERINELTLEGSFRLSYNASVFTREGLGYLLTFEHLVNTSSESGLVFRPLYPELTTDMFIIWKKYQVFTPIAERFINELQKEFGRNN